MTRKNLQNFDKIKARLLLFAENQGIAKGEFYEKISLFPSNFAGKGGESALKSDNIVKVLTQFPEINPDWLLLGKGEMLRGSAPEAPPDSTLSVLLERIEDLARENGQLQAENAELKKELAQIASARIVSAEAAAG